MLRAIAKPFIQSVEWMYRTPKLRRLLIETRSEFDDSVQFDVAGTPIKICISSRMENMRAQHILTKEPDTISWLNKLQPNELFIDVGANIGIYSLYAAAVRGSRVIAFEPEAQNFAALVKNISLNNLGDRVSAWPYALSSKSGPLELNLTAITAGGSQHTAGEPINELGRRFKPIFVQGAVAIQLDTALEKIVPGEAPRFIKIDIDGAEQKVIAGMAAQLNTPSLEQILIEMPVDRSKAPAIYERIKGAGFVASAPGWVNNERGNVIFTRKNPGKHV